MTQDDIQATGGPYPSPADGRDASGCPPKAVVTVQPTGRDTHDRAQAWLRNAMIAAEPRHRPGTAGGPVL